MAAIIELFTNEAVSTLASGITSVSATLTVQAGKGALFPQPVVGTSFFKITITSSSAPNVLYEICYVTARSGDTLTITRGQDGTTAQAWSALDLVMHAVTAKTMQANVQPWWAADTGAVNAYIVNIPQYYSAYQNGMTVTFWTTHASTTTTPTLNVNGLGAAVITDAGGGAVIAGAIPANIPINLIYNSATSTWALQSTGAYVARTTAGYIGIGISGATATLTLNATTYTSWPISISGNAATAVNAYSNAFTIPSSAAMSRVVVSGSGLGGVPVSAFYTTGDQTVIDRSDVGALLAYTLSASTTALYLKTNTSNTGLATLNNTPTTFTLNRSDLGNIIGFGTGLGTYINLFGTTSTTPYTIIQNTPAVFQITRSDVGNLLVSQPTSGISTLSLPTTVGGKSAALQMDTSGVYLSESTLGYILYRQDTTSTTALNLFGAGAGAYTTVANEPGYPFIIANNTLGNILTVTSGGVFTYGGVTFAPGNVAGGYYRGANGIIIQWGQLGFNYSGYIYFPIAFPNAGLGIVVCESNASGWTTGNADVIGTSGFAPWGAGIGACLIYGKQYDPNQGKFVPGLCSANYIAIGY